jgi:hypothetical protein
MYSLNIWIVNIFEGTLVVNKADTLASITAATSKTLSCCARSTPPICT